MRPAAQEILDIISTNPKVEASGPFYNWNGIGQMPDSLAENWEAIRDAWPWFLRCHETRKIWTTTWEELNFLSQRGLLPSCEDGTFDFQTFNARNH